MKELLKIAGIIIVAIVVISVFHNALTPQRDYQPTPNVPSKALNAEESAAAAADRAAAREHRAVCFELWQAYRGAKIYNDLPPDCPKFD